MDEILHFGSGGSKRKCARYEPFSVWAKRVDGNSKDEIDADFIRNAVGRYKGIILWF